ncbi:MAG: exo-alpha-sialidase, partial [Bacteroidetes bacterium]|nr:exo-alpha-sialidase [Bacteroidota bacterium]
MKASLPPRVGALWMMALLLMPVASLRAQPTDETLFQAFRWRNIGPANMGGRVVDIEAVEDDFTRVFLASASGGVWKSVNAGTTWEPIFDHYASASIGDIALFQPNPDLLWVGTGEANNRNSVSWGDGVYKSTDGGATFEHVGLAETHQIARIITHPTDPDVVYVCAIGHLWGYSGGRGLFQTTDGGQSWTKLAGGLPDDGRTGCTDLVRHPTDPAVLYTAFYHRLRQPWTFHSGGENGGIFKSVDGGATWEKLTNGLPEGETGRIGLAIYRQNPDILMALVEAARTDTLAAPGSGVYRSEDAGQSWTYVNTYNNRPFYYSQIRINPHDDQRVYVLTTRFMVSDDGGQTLRNGSED